MMNRIYTVSSTQGVPYMSCVMRFPTVWHLKIVGSDDLGVQPPFKVRNPKRCLVSSLTVLEYSSSKQRLCSDYAYAQADLSLCWSPIPHCWFV